MGMRVLIGLNTAGFKWIVLGAVFLLALGTVYALKVTDRFYVETQQLLANPDWSAATMHWSERGGGEIAYVDGALSITNDTKTGHSVFQRLSLEGPGFFRLNFVASGRDIQTEEPVWTGGSIGVVEYDSKGEKRGSQTLFRLRQSQPMQFYSYQIYLDDRFDSVELQLRLLRSSGVFTVGKLELSSLGEYPTYKRLKATVVVFWGLALVVLFVFVIRSINRTQAVVLMCFCAMALAGTVMPSRSMGAFSEYLVSVIPEIVMVGFTGFLESFFGLADMVGTRALSKVGHFGVFLCIGVMAGWDYRRLGFVFSVATIFVFSLLTEVFQLLIIGRTATVMDWLIDCTAGFTGVCIGAGALVLCQFFQSNGATGSQKLN